VIGINNRDIRGLERDAGGVEVTEALAPLAPPGSVVLSESGLASAADVRRALAAGATAVLVGTAILGDPDPPARLARLAAELRAA
jgi:indole-3-glycerol phosphate synthase